MTILYIKTERHSIASSYNNAGSYDIFVTLPFWKDLFYGLRGMPGKVL